MSLTACLPAGQSTRLILREDNADLRLTEKGRELGLVDDERWTAFSDKKERIEKESERLRAAFIHPGSDAASTLENKLSRPISREYSLLELLRRPELTYNDVAGLVGEAETHDQVAEQVEIQTPSIRGTLIVRQKRSIVCDAMRIPAYRRPLDYTLIEGLSNELKQKLSDARPETLGRASCIQGMTPAAVSLLLVYMKKRSIAA